MKVCSRCKKVKNEEEFNFKIKSKNIRAYHCKKCSRSYIKSHYYKNREYYLLKANERNQRVRRKIRAYVWSYLSIHSCVDCGEKDPIVLEFDHIKDKLFTISSVGRDKKLSEVQKEIEKCEVRCANCHRRKTALQLGWQKKVMPL